MVDKELIELAQTLISRLERLSVDSYWAHRSSGIRGALIRCVEKLATENLDNHEFSDLKCLESLISRGYFLLEKAAREIPDHKNNYS